MKITGKEILIITFFAVLHAIMTVFSRWQGLSNDLMLTTLTMLMAVSLCQIKKTNVNAMIILLIIVNFGGFYLGRYIGRSLHFVTDNPYLRCSVTTFSTTVIVGFLVSILSSLINKSRYFQRADEINTYWLLFAFTVIIISRLILIVLNKREIYYGNVTLNVMIDYTFCCVAMLFLAMNAINASKKEQEAKELHNISQYSYIRLQQQVKPHFMFNNLSILNSLICDHQIKAASDFVYKLAYLYRYMIENEDEKLVTLREEMDFVSKYTDLMKVRFESSFNVEISLNEDVMNRLVIPCSIQLLIENAIKHNGGTNQSPLHIRVYNDSTNIIVSNNILKKMSEEYSTRLGLKYIKQLYEDVSHKKVTVRSDEEEFVVILPIIN